MITTIQIHEEVKNELDQLKQSSRETYEDVIIKMIKTIENQKMKEKKLLIEGYKEMAEDSLITVKEWEATETDWN